MNKALQIPSPEEVFVLLQKKVGSARFHTQVDLFPKIAIAVGGKYLTPTQIADALYLAFRTYTTNFEKTLIEATIALLGRIIAAFISDEIHAKQIHILLVPRVAYT